jgi:DNA repair exonuclease SbcCD ATPase subunit
MEGGTIMSDEFTVDEIREAVTLARIYSQGYAEEQFRASVELVERLGESGYLEAVSGIAKLEKEKGVHFAEALDACERLVNDKAVLEQKLGDLEVKLEVTKRELTEAQGTLSKLKEAAEQAEAERQKEEAELAVVTKKAKREKGRIDKELEEYQQRANLTEQEVDMASRIKAEVDIHGLTLDLVLDLAQEFAGYEDSRGELAKGLEEYGSVGESIRALEADLSELQKSQNEKQTRVDSLEERRHQLESTISQLQADATYEEELRRFYRRYHGVSSLIDYLAAWNQVYFVRCNNPLFALTGAVSRSAGNAHFWMDKSPNRCPHCGSGSNLLVYDEGPYQALGIPAGTPVRLLLGE